MLPFPRYAVRTSQPQEGTTMNRKEAIEAIAAKFPDETVTQTDPINGGTREVHWTAEKRLDLHYIGLSEPFFDGLKEGGTGLNEEDAQTFLNAVEHNYKNATGGW